MSEKDETLRKITELLEQASVWKLLLILAIVRLYAGEAAGMSNELLQSDPVYQLYRRLRNIEDDLLARRLRDIEDELLALAKDVAQLAAERAGNYLPGSYQPPSQSNHGG